MRIFSLLSLLIVRVKYILKSWAFSVRTIKLLIWKICLNIYIIFINFIFIFYIFSLCWHRWVLDSICWNIWLLRMKMLAIGNLVLYLYHLRLQLQISHISKLHTYLFPVTGSKCFSFYVKCLALQWPRLCLLLAVRRMLTKLHELFQFFISNFGQRWELKLNLPHLKLLWWLSQSLK